MNCKIYFLSALLLCLLSFACSKEENQVLEIQIDAEKSNLALLPTESEVLENRMQWASFIVAEILFDDNEDQYRSDFIAALYANQNIILLENLIGNNETFPGFEDEFKALFLLYYNGTYPYSSCENGRPNASEDKPFHFASIILDLFGDYKAYMLEENCIELYFPNALVFSTETLDSLERDVLYITSTAHPLTAGSSIGYRRSDCNADIYDSVEEIGKVDELYLLENDNIIIARPTEKSNCKYSESDY